MRKYFFFTHAKLCKTTECRVIFRLTKGWHQQVTLLRASSHRRAKYKFMLYSTNSWTHANFVWFWCLNGNYMHAENLSLLHARKQSCDGISGARVVWGYAIWHEGRRLTYVRGTSSSSSYDKIFAYLYIYMTLIIARVQTNQISVPNRHCKFSACYDIVLI